MLFWFILVWRPLDAILDDYRFIMKRLLRFSFTLLDGYSIFIKSRLIFPLIISDAKGIPTKRLPSSLSLSRTATQSPWKIYAQITYFGSSCIPDRSQRNFSPEISHTISYVPSDLSQPAPSHQRHPVKRCEDLKKLSCNGWKWEEHHGISAQ